MTRTFERRGLPFMLIGGQAVLVHGRPRLTEDIDATLGVGTERLADVLEACRELGLEPLPEDLEHFVADTMVLPARHASSRLRVDLVFSTLPYERQAIDRAKRIPLGGTEVPFATAEDLLIHKLFAGRPRDLEDALSVVRRQGQSLDWDYLARWIGEFAEVPGREDMRDRLRSLRKEAEQGDRGDR